MGYSPYRDLLEHQSRIDYRNEEQMEKLRVAIKKNAEEMQELIASFDKSEQEQKRLNDLIKELKKEKTSSLDMLLLLKIIMSDDLSDFDLVSDQVIQAAEEKYPNNPNMKKAWLEGAAYVYYALMTKKKETAYHCGVITLDDAIQHCKDVLPLCETDEVRAEHIQLGRWLEELKELREWKNSIKKSISKV